MKAIIIFDKESQKNGELVLQSLFPKECYKIRNGVYIIRRPSPNQTLAKSIGIGLSKPAFSTEAINGLVFGLDGSLSGNWPEQLWDFFEGKEPKKKEEEK